MVHVALVPFTGACGIRPPGENEVEPGGTKKKQGGAPKCVASFTMKPWTVEDHIVGSVTPPRFEVSARIKQTDEAMSAPARTFCGHFML